MSIAGRLKRLETTIGKVTAKPDSARLQAIVVALCEIDSPEFHARPAAERLRLLREACSAIGTLDEADSPLPMLAIDFQSSEYLALPTDKRLQRIREAIERACNDESEMNHALC